MLTLTSAILLFGIAQCVIIIGLILTTRKSTLSNKLLVMILLVLGVSVLPTLFGHLELVEQYDGLLFIPLHLQLFIFPLLHLYFNALFRSDFRFDKQSTAHLIVPIVFWVYFCFVWINTLGAEVADKRGVAIDLYYFWISPMHDLSLMSMALGYSWYAFRSLLAISEAKVPKRRHRHITWIRWLLALLLFGAVMDFLSFGLGQVYGYWRGSPIDDWLGYSFSLLVKDYYAIIAYLISLLGYASYSRISEGRRADESIMTGDVHRITSLMEEDKMYLDPSLNLSTLARAIGTTPGRLSATLNRGLGMSFNDLVNQYRVEEVKQKLESDQIDQYTLLGLALDSGFSSKATFYRAFQKYTGHTPKAYLKQTVNPQ